MPEEKDVKKSEEKKEDQKSKATYKTVFGDLNDQEYHEKFKSIFEQVKDRLYLTLGYVSFKTQLCGTEIEVRTLRKRENDFLKMHAPVDLILDSVQQLILKTRTMEDSDVLGSVLGELAKKVNLQVRHTNLLLSFSLLKFKDLDYAITFPSEVKSFEEFCKLPKVEEKLIKIDNMPATLVDFIMALSLNVNTAFDIALSESMKNPF